MTADDHRVLFVHAHPDDESLGTGATIAKYAEEGARVTLVTCTLGEEGEVVTPELAHLAADRECGLGERRKEELAEAVKLLGIAEHRFLGGPGRWRDSGMMSLASNERADCFWRADPEQAAAALVDVIKEVRPQVLVTYDEKGVYGHPDHIQAHRVSVRAVAAVRGTPYEIAKLYFATIPKSAITAMMGAVSDADNTLEVPDEVSDFGVEDDRITTRIDARSYLRTKLDALRAHSSQVAAHAPWFNLPDPVAREVLGVEYYVLDGSPGATETDLFAGLAASNGSKGA